MLKKVVFKLIKRVIFRLLHLPTYIFIATPWLFVSLKLGSDDFLNDFSQVFAWLAGKPGETEFDGGDIAKATSVLFLGLNTAFEIIYLVFGLAKKLPFYKVEQAAKLAIGILGWLAFLVVFASDLSAGAVGTWLMFLIIMIILIGFEYAISWLLKKLETNVKLGD